MTNEIMKSPQQGQALSVYADANSFEHAQRIAKMLCTSSLVPSEYQNNMSNTLVAMEMANRVGVSPLMVMQNLNVIQGRPSWSSPYIIASINTCGRFAPIKFQFEDRGMKKVAYNYWTGSKSTNDRRKETGTLEVRDTACRAVSKDASGDILEGPWVSIEMAIHEGWYTKADSKWKTMPEVMLRYRAAAFFGRLYCPEIMMGMHTTEELNDIQVEARPASGAAAINATINAAPTISQPVAAQPAEPIDHSVNCATSTPLKKARKAQEQAQESPIQAAPVPNANDDNDLV